MEKKIKVLAIGAHADESQGCCGGTLRLLYEAGCECTALHVANHNHFRTEEELKVFDHDISRSCEMLGLREIVIGDRGEHLYEGDRHDRELIMEQLEAIQPDIVFLMWPQDSHPEHRRVAQTSYDAILNSFWNGKLNSVREIYAMEADANQTMMYFQPDFYIVIESVAEVLQKALTICIKGKGELIARRKADKSRYRGWCANMGSTMTEAFKVVKFPSGIGMDESDLLLRRILAKQFLWAGASPWPYGNQYYQN